MAMTTFFLISIFALAAKSVHAAQHVVGDSNGWTNLGDYTTWAASKTFNVGDTLLFNYGGSHGVDVVPKSDYDNCATSNAINSYIDGATTISLTQPGPMYFVCPSFGHCSSGMKLAINVVSKNSNSPAATTPNDGSNSSPTSTTTTTTTPSNSNPTKDAGSANSANMMVATFSLILAPLVVFMC